MKSEGQSVVVLGTGAYTPERVLTNHDLAKLVDTSDEWIVTRSGIRERHIAAANEATSDLAVKAGTAAIEAAGLKPADIDLLIVATCTRLAAADRVDGRPAQARTGPDRLFRSRRGLQWLPLRARNRR